MHMLTFAHILDGSNFGDSVCCPRRYFPKWSRCPEVDFRQLPPGDSPVIVGGGGMLHPEVDDWIEKTSQERPLILWGVGLNYHVDTHRPDWQAKVRHCKLVSLRDRPEAHPFKQVPDPTCMHPAFQRYTRWSPSTDLVTYEHFEHGIPQYRGPRMNNRIAPGKTLDSVVRFLTQGKCVLTNSYHGALWAMWLGRAVILWRPFSNRFLSGLPPTGNLEVADHLDDIERFVKVLPPVQTGSRWLNFAVGRNMNFYELVCNTF
jgi:hypothetical protein